MPKRTRSATVLWAVQFMLLTRSITGQQTAAVSQAFRENERQFSERFLAAVEAMPADKYTFKPTPPQASFAQITQRLSWYSDWACSSIAGLKQPERDEVPAAGGKELLLAQLRTALQFCEQALRGVDDSLLGDSVEIYMEFNHRGQPMRMTRAAAMTLTTAHWAEAYTEVTGYLRAAGHIPPVPCTGAGTYGLIDTSCDLGRVLCVDKPGRNGLTMVLSDEPYSVTSDGRGPYRAGLGNVTQVAAARPAVMVFGSAAKLGTSRRSIRVDLNHPVSGDIGVPLGVISDDHNLEIGAQWYTDADYKTHGMLEIPIGTHVNADQTDVGIHINGAYHVLQMGPMPYGHCVSDGTAIYGAGTTRGTIYRASADEWIVDLPPGSIGRLFDDHLGDPYAINKGLYYVSLHYVLRK